MRNMMKYIILLVGFMGIVAWRSILPTTIRPMTSSLQRRSLMELAEQKGIVTMYKKEGCRHCKAAKELLIDKYELDVKLVDVESDDREEVLNQMRSFSGGRNTVPQIFFNAEHLGGNDDIQKLEIEGKLKEKVEYVRNTPVNMMQDHWYHPWY